nr:MAG TPA: hypothetical protein [Caudoviricetes sp.]DAZ79795.1 MAG TPA: hypothetical protein [Caudoviricetes sp.]
MVTSRKKNKGHTHPKGGSSREIVAILFMYREVKQRC